MEDNDALEDYYGTSIHRAEGARTGNFREENDEKIRLL